MAETGTVIIPAPNPEQHLTFNPGALLTKAIESKMDAESIQKLSDLAERWMAIQAQERFANAMQEFRRRCPHIMQQRRADAGPVKFSYAAYEDIRRVTDPIDADLGISTSFDIPGYDSEKGTISGTLRIRVGSYFEDKHFTLRIPKLQTKDGRDIISATQQDGQAISYFKRYALIAGRDLVVTDEDNENQLNAVSDEQIKQIEALIESCKRVSPDGKTFDYAKFFAWVGVPTINEIPQGRFDEVVQVLQRKAAK